MSVFDDLGSISPHAIWDGVIARAVAGERVSLAVIELEPDAVVAEHNHPNEQLGVVIAGTMRFRVGDEERELVAGDTYRIASEMPHEAVAGPEGAVVIDVFAPPRGDWEGMERLDPQRPRWP
jgi:quercetin dioxygenase-like cupin family protein